ncbi:MAG TPA: DUF1801 domain-containing protein [Phototrophicaceae bacterium]|nr:DUF1801 domain-containing protein [Phototrophicaceae bacterium]
MDEQKKAPANFEEYFANYSPEIQERLEALRQTIHQAAPQAEEIISYGMPTFRWKQNLVYFSVSRKHIGFYPTNEPIEALHDRVAEYATSKGTLQFPFSKPLPLDLVTEVVKYRVEQVARKK